MSDNEPISGASVLIADDHALVREGMSSMLKKIDGIANIVEESNGNNARTTLVGGEFDIAILDIGLPGLSGIDVACEVRKRGLALRIIIMTGINEHELPRKLIMECKPDAFFVKTAGTHQVKKAVLAVLNGRTHFPEGFNSAPNDCPDGVSVDDGDLSLRENQVIRLIAQGHTSESAASVLGISPHTIRKHRENIKRKLGIGTLAELSTYAVRRGIL